MRIEKITNKVLIWDEKQLETVGFKYKELHKLVEPFEKEIK